MLVFHNKMAHNQHYLIQQCGKVLKKIIKPGSMSYLPAIKVPILRFKESNSGIDIDLSVNNILAIYNTDLVFTYC